MRGLSISMFVGSVVSLVMGFYKMFVYENPESYYSNSKNAYVGGDSYNYIINGTYATGYFVLFGSLLIAGLLVELIAIANRSTNNRPTKKTKAEKSETPLEKYYIDREESEKAEQVSDNEVESQQSIQTSK